MGNGSGKWGMGQKAGHPRRYPLDSSLPSMWYELPASPRVHVEECKHSGNCTNNTALTLKPLWLSSWENWCEGVRVSFNLLSQGNQPTVVWPCVLQQNIMAAGIVGAALHRNRCWAGWFFCAFYSNWTLTWWDDVVNIHRWLFSFLLVLSGIAVTDTPTGLC